MSTLTKKQRVELGPRVFTKGGESYRITAYVRHDDDCGNGHNTFSVTCDIERLGNGTGSPLWFEDSGGCLHDEFAKHFPEYAHLVKWHLSSTDGPMHYIANTVYLAGNRDHNGRRQGDISRLAYGVRFGNSPITHKTKESFWYFLQERKETGDFQVVAIARANESGGYQFKPKYTLAGYGEKWHECPFSSKAEAHEFCDALNTVEVGFVSIPVEYSEGKERDLDAARNTAVWPDATDADLTSPGLKERLEARLLHLQVDFRHDVEAFGLTW